MSTERRPKTRILSGVELRIKTAADLEKEAESQIKNVKLGDAHRTYKKCLQELLHALDEEVEGTENHQALQEMHQYVLLKLDEVTAMRRCEHLLKPGKGTI
mmetsp:Transcript_19050/g.44470  ORF Transcript_19050/g.44470 Transcript_19050/m.44470 type:complete len:101 (-) Transcript_19050:184-486(-)